MFKKWFTKNARDDLSLEDMYFDARDEDRKSARLGLIVAALFAIAATTALTVHGDKGTPQMAFHAAASGWMTGFMGTQIGAVLAVCVYLITDRISFNNLLKKERAYAIEDFMRIKAKTLQFRFVSPWVALYPICGLLNKQYIVSSILLSAIILQKIIIRITHYRTKAYCEEQMTF